MPATGNRIWLCAACHETVVRPERHACGRPAQVGQRPEFKCTGCRAAWAPEAFHVCPGAPAPGFNGVLPPGYERIPPATLQVKVAELFCEEDLRCLQGTWFTGRNVEVVVAGARVRAARCGEEQHVQVTPDGVSLMGVRLLGNPVGQPVRLVWADGDVWAKKGAPIPYLYREPGARSAARDEVDDDMATVATG